MEKMKIRKTVTAKEKGHKKGNEKKLGKWKKSGKRSGKK